MIQLRLAGAALPDSMLASLRRAEVEQELNLPSTCVVEIGSVDFTQGDWQGIDLSLARLGAAIELSFGAGDSPLFTGEVGEILADFGNESTVEFRGFDALYKLQFGTAQVVYEGQSDPAMAIRIAKRNGLEPAVDESSVKYPYVLQANQSDFAFLASRAARLHYEFFVTGSTLHFRRSRAGESAVVTLQWKEQIIELSVRLRAVKQGSSVQAVGWDPKNKRAIVANVNSGPATLRMGGKETGYQLSTEIAPSPVSGMDPEIVDPEAARAVAEAAYVAGLDDFIEAEAVLVGEPSIQPGVNVRLAGIGSRLSGPYYVTAAKHLYSQDGGYRTQCVLRRTGA
ncbi:phage late control D family protein [Corallococcus llansteffanensis]|uniref:Phage late control D family protein n=1 Tax=Corallococcus llansteffanensis TaxID=2316731 RepID=A0A3A8NI17_9BACT|nr:phage late control D family protein [Corallococcus llansteffanensis]RKH40795.1 phage late control D family protein [Corallococcus llansteffanensis]